MSEFKFACPVCGQHITADSAASGAQLDCPTCFQKLNVPQAPTAGGSKLILSATLVAKPRPAAADETPARKLSKPRLRASIYGLAIGLLAVSAVSSAFLHWRGEVLINALHKKPEVVTPAPVYSVPSDAAWTLDLTQAAIPDSPVAGRVHGSGFYCERAILRGGLLSLRQGKVWPPDLGLSIHFFVQQGEDLGGKTIVVRADRKPPLPEVIIRWKDDQHQPANERIDSGYALKLVFGQAVDGKMPGRIFIALPDQSNSFAAGTFEALIRKPPPPKPQPTSGSTGG